MDCDGRISLDDFRSMLMSNFEYQMHHRFKQTNKSDSKDSAKKRIWPMRSQNVRNIRDDDYSSSPSKRSVRKQISPARRLGAVNSIDKA